MIVQARRSQSTPARHGRLVVSWAALLLLTAASLPAATEGGAESPDPAKVLEKCERAYTKIRTYRSRFSYECHTTRPATKVAGRILLSAPGQLVLNLA